MAESSCIDFDGGTGQHPPSSLSRRHDHPNAAAAVIQEDPDDLLSKSLRNRNLHEYTCQDSSNYGSQKVPPLHKRLVGKSKELLFRPLERRVLAISRAKKPEPSRGEPPLELLTAKELNSCIIASETTRAICSVLIALLVVISYVDYPLLGINLVNSKSMVALKPLYMVLLTDITVVFALLILKKRGSIRVVEEEENNSGKVPSEETLNWDRAVRVLERGLVLHQTLRALFIDCSVYVVTVACGLSLI